MNANARKKWSRNAVAAKLRGKGRPGRDARAHDGMGLGGQARRVFNVTIWFIGFLFTVGYLNYLEMKLKWYQSLGFLALLFALWPLCLGMEFGGHMDDQKDTDTGHGGCA